MKIELEVLSFDGKAITTETLTEGKIEDTEFSIQKIIAGPFILIELKDKKYVLKIEDLIKKIYIKEFENVKES